MLLGSGIDSSSEESFEMEVIASQFREITKHVC